jgi:putative component of toxin-antitoxin plasmid stabilization module
MQNGNPGNMNPTAAGNFQLRVGHPQLGWAYIKAGR